MADLVFLCPQERDRRAISRLDTVRERVAFVGADLDSTAVVDIDGVVNACAAHRPTGVVGTKDRSALLAAIVAERLNLPGPTPNALLNCQHKLRSRELQRQAVPEATPRFVAVGGSDPLPYPYFVKPVVGRLSDGAVRVDGPADLVELSHGREYARAYEAIAGAAGAGADDYSGFLAEELLTGAEVTLEGFVHEGRVQVIGITDSVKYEHSASFERFEYPSALDEARQGECAVIASRLMPALGFDGGFFNIEFFIPPDGGPKITEVNGRIASQFAPLLEFAHGQSSYQALVSLALGEEPSWPEGPSSGVALSYCLRVFEDGLVGAIPEAADDLELLVEPGLLLSQQGTNDVESYRLCIFVEAGADRASTVAAARARAAALLAEFQLLPT